MLVIVMILQCVALCVSAANFGLVGYSGSRDTILIQLNQEGQQDSDFVEEHPESLFLTELELEQPTPAQPLRQVYEQIPLYVQGAYPHALYGQGSVTSCGSSITALAMVATYLTGYDYQPDVLARNFAGKADSDDTRLLHGICALNLPFETSDEWDLIRQALEEGKCVILRLKVDSVFAEKKHYIVLRAITEEGKILIHDPLDANYNKAELKEGFETGFEETLISDCAQLGWIFDPADVQEDIAWYVESAAELPGDRYDSLELTPTEKQLLARVSHVLGYGECVEGKQVLVEVILNRMLSEEFPDDLRQIIFGENALCESNVLNEVELTDIDWMCVEKAIYGPYLLEKDVTDFSFECHK
jgi:hypothetical protein